MDPETKKRAFSEMREMARKMKADQYAKKFAPPDAAPADVAAGQAEFDALAKQGAANAALGAETVQGNEAALKGMDEEKLKHVLKGLRKSDGPSSQRDFALAS